VFLTFFPKRVFIFDDKLNAISMGMEALLIDQVLLVQPIISLTSSNIINIQIKNC